LVLLIAMIHTIYIMKNRYSFLLIIFLLGGWSTNGIAQERTKKIDRLIKKQIGKFWKDGEIKEKRVDTKFNADFEMFFLGNELYRLETTKKTVGFLLLRRGFGCKIGGCGGSGEQGDGQVCSADGSAYEYFDYTILLDANLSILKVAVVDYPGDYGYEITSKGWLKQFKGYKGEQLKYGKDIDAISGATISANSLTLDIVAVHDLLSKYIQDSTMKIAQK